MRLERALIAPGLLVAAGGLLVAATVQSATGFGFALIAGPVLYAVASPPAAVALVLVIGEVVNVLVCLGSAADRRSTGRRCGRPAARGRAGVSRDAGAVLCRDP
jgi:uncharacterized membrane protein YfcA